MELFEWKILALKKNFVRDPGKVKICYFFSIKWVFIEREFRMVEGSFFVPKMKLFSAGLWKTLIKLILGNKSEKGENMANWNFTVFTETTGQQKQYFTPLACHSTLVKISAHDF